MKYIFHQQKMNGKFLTYDCSRYLHYHLFLQHHLKYRQHHILQHQIIFQAYHKYFSSLLKAQKHLRIEHMFVYILTRRCFKVNIILPQQLLNLLFIWRLFLTCLPVVNIWCFKNFRHIQEIFMMHDIIKCF